MVMKERDTVHSKVYKERVNRSINQRTENKVRCRLEAREKVVEQSFEHTNKSMVQQGSWML